VIAEIPAGGVLLPAAAMTAAVAFGLFLVAHALARRVGFYRLVWHPGLFDLAAFILLWAAISALPAHLPAAWLSRV
jgi:protein AaeX